MTSVVNSQVTFRVQQTSLVEASSEKAWKQLISLSQWPQWDRRLESVNAKEIKEGAMFSLKPSVGNEIAIKIDSIKERCFSDSANLQFGKITTKREIFPIDQDHCLLTQSMTATVDLKIASLFAKTFWPEWRQGILDSTQRFGTHVSQSELLALHKNS